MCVGLRRPKGGRHPVGDLGRAESEQRERGAAHRAEGSRPTEGRAAKARAEPTPGQRPKGAKGGERAERAGGTGEKAYARRATKASAASRIAEPPHLVFPRPLSREGLDGRAAGSFSAEPELRERGAAARKTQTRQCLRKARREAARRSALLLLVSSQGEPRSGEPPRLVGYGGVTYEQTLAEFTTVILYGSYDLYSRHFFYSLQRIII